MSYSHQSTVGVFDAQGKPIHFVPVVKDEQNLLAFLYHEVQLRSA